MIILSYKQLFIRQLSAKITRLKPALKPPGAEVKMNYTTRKIKIKNSKTKLLLIL